MVFGVRAAAARSKAAPQPPAPSNCAARPATTPSRKNTLVHDASRVLDEKLSRLVDGVGPRDGCSTNGGLLRRCHRGAHGAARVAVTAG